MKKQWKHCQSLFLGGSKITANGDCSYDIKRCWLLGRNVLTNLDNILKRNITLPTKVRLAKAMALPVVIYGCKSYTIKKAEHWRINGFELWCWKRLLRVPWTARRSTQSILKEISPGCLLVGLMLKLKLQYFGHLMQKADSFEKTLILGKIVGRRQMRRQRMRLLVGIKDSMYMSVAKLWELVMTGRPGVLPSMGSQRDMTEWLNWTEVSYIGQFLLEMEILPLSRLNFGKL